MRVLGIIAEYDPFHNGHLYHLQQAMARAEADCSVAVMSGNFVQRGEPAMWDKRLRARMAVENGVDLVLELPFAYACNTASEFARGGISLLAGLGCVTDLAFGCEGDPQALYDAAKMLHERPRDFEAALSSGQKSGLSYAAAVSNALIQCGEREAAALLSKPNNILAAEYMRRCMEAGSSMKFWGIPRSDGGYHCAELPCASGEPDPAASAGAVRAAWRKGGADREAALRFLPEATRSLLERAEGADGGAATVSIEDFYPIIAAKILTADDAELAEIYGVTGGMEHAMKKALRTSADVRSLISAIKTKRYTWTGISRALIQAAVGFTREDYVRITEQRLNYAHVLAFNERGRALLAHIKKQETAALPVFSNLSRGSASVPHVQPLLHYDIVAADLYHLAAGKMIYPASDFVLRPFHSF